MCSLAHTPGSIFRCKGQVNISINQMVEDLQLRGLRFNTTDSLPLKHHRLFFSEASRLTWQALFVMAACLPHEKGNSRAPGKKSCPICSIPAFIYPILFNLGLDNPCKLRRTPKYGFEHTESLRQRYINEESPQLCVPSPILAFAGLHKGISVSDFLKQRSGSISRYRKPGLRHEALGSHPVDEGTRKPLQESG